MHKKELSLEIIVGQALAVKLDKLASAVPHRQIRVRTTTTHRDTMISEMLTWFSSLPETSSIALLTEAGTEYGKLEDEHTSPNPDRKIVQLKFPHNIGQLRAMRNGSIPEDASSNKEKDVNTASIAKSISASETIPLLSTRTSVLNELALDELTARIQREQIDVVGIIATDVEDTIFLAERIKAKASDTQLFVIGAEIAYLDPSANRVMRGSLIATPYPLYMPAHNWTTPRSGDVARAPILSSASCGLYNATLAMLGHKDRLIDYGPPAFEKQPCTWEQSKDIPGVWISVIGTDAMYPLSFKPGLGGSESETSRDQQAYRDRAINTCNPEGTQEPPRLHARSVATTIIPLWVTAWIVCCWQFFNNQGVWQCLEPSLQARARRSLLRHLATHLRARPWMRHLHWPRNLPSLFLFAVAYCATSVMLLIVLQCISEGWSHVASIVLSASLVVCAIYTASACAHCFLRRGKAMSYFAGGMAFFVTFVAIWCCQHATPQRQEYLQLLAYRAVNPVSLVSPLTPILLATFGWGLIVFTILQRDRVAAVYPTALQFPVTLGASDLPEIKSLHERLHLQLYPAVFRVCIKPDDADMLRYVVAVFTVSLPLIALYWRSFCPSDMHNVIRYHVAVIVCSLLVGIVFVTVSLYLLWGTMSRLTNRLEQTRLSSGWSRIPQPLRELVRRFGAQENVTNSKLCIVVQHAANLNRSAQRWNAVNKLRLTVSLPARPESIWEAYRNAVDGNAGGVECDAFHSPLFKTLIALSREWTETLSFLSRRRSVDATFPYSKDHLVGTDATGAHKLRGWEAAVGDEECAEICSRAEEFVGMMTVVYLNPYLYYLRKMSTGIAGTVVLLLLALNSYPIYPHGWLTAIVWATILAIAVTIAKIYVSMERNAFISLVNGKTPDAIDFDWELIQSTLQAVVPLAGIVLVQFGELGNTVYHTLLEPLINLTS